MRFGVLVLFYIWSLWFRDFVILECGVLDFGVPAKAAAA